MEHRRFGGVEKQRLICQPMVVPALADEFLEQPIDKVIQCVGVTVPAAASDFHVIQAALLGLSTFGNRRFEPVLQSRG